MELGGGTSITTLPHSSFDPKQSNSAPNAASSIREQQASCVSLHSSCRNAIDESHLHKQDLDNRRFRGQQSDTLDYSTSTTSPQIPATTFMRNSQSGFSSLPKVIEEAEPNSGHLPLSDLTESSGGTGRRPRRRSSNGEQQSEGEQATLASDSSDSTSTCNSTPSPTLTTVMSDPIQASLLSSNRVGLSHSGSDYSNETSESTQIAGAKTVDIADGNGGAWRQRSTSDSKCSTTKHEQCVLMQSNNGSTYVHVETQSETTCSTSSERVDGGNSYENHSSQNPRQAMNDALSTLAGDLSSSASSTISSTMQAAMSGESLDGAITPEALMALSRFASKLDVSKRTVLLKLLFQMSFDAVQGRPDQTSALMELQALALAAGHGENYGSDNSMLNTAANHSDLQSNPLSSYDMNTNEMTDTDARLAMETLQVFFSRLSQVSNGGSIVAAQIVQSHHDAFIADTEASLHQTNFQHKCREYTLSDVVSDSGAKMSHSFDFRAESLPIIVEILNPDPSHRSHELPTVNLAETRCPRTHPALHYLRNRPDQRVDLNSQELQPRSLDFASQNQKGAASSPAVPPGPYDQALLDAYYESSERGYTDIHPSASYMTGISDQMAKSLSTKFYETADPIPHSIVLRNTVGVNGVPTDKLEASIDIAPVIVANIEIDVDVSSGMVVNTYPIPVSPDAIHAALSSSNDYQLASLIAYEVPYQDANEYIHKIAEQRKAEILYRKQRIASKRKAREEALAQQRKREMEKERIMQSIYSTSDSVDTSSQRSSDTLYEVNQYTQKVNEVLKSAEHTETKALSVQKNNSLQSSEKSTSGRESTASPHPPSSDDQGTRTRRIHSRTGRRCSESSIEDSSPLQGAASFGGEVSNVIPIPSPTSNTFSLRSRRAASNRRNGGIDSGSLAPMSPILAPPVLTPHPSVNGYPHVLSNQAKTRGVNSSQSNARFDAPLPSPVTRRYSTRGSQNSANGSDGLGLSVGVSSFGSGVQVIPQTPLPSPALPPRLQNGTANQSAARRSSLSAVQRSTSYVDSDQSFPMPSSSSGSTQFFPQTASSASLGTLPSRKSRQAHGSPITACGGSNTQTHQSIRSPSTSTRTMSDDTVHGTPNAFARFKTTQTSQLLVATRQTETKANDLSIVIAPDDISPLIISANGQTDHPTPLLMGNGHDSPPAVSYMTSAMLTSSLSKEVSTPFKRVQTSGGSDFSSLTESEATLLNDQLSYSESKGPNRKSHSSSNANSVANEDMKSTRLGRKRSSSRLCKIQNGDGRISSSDSPASSSSQGSFNDCEATKRIRQ